MISIVCDRGYGHRAKQAEAVLFAAQHEMSWVGLDLHPAKSHQSTLQQKQLNDDYLSVHFLMNYFK